MKIYQSWVYLTRNVVDFTAAGIMATRPDYSLFENNCQNFIRYLIDAISPGSDVWSSVRIVMDRLSIGGEDLRYPIPGGYPQSFHSSESSNSSFATATNSEIHESGLSHSATGSDLEDKETPDALQTLFRSNLLLQYDPELAKQAEQEHQLGLGGFSAVYLVFP